MRISKLEPAAVKKGCWLVHLEDGAILRVSEAEMADYSLYTGMDLDGQTLSGLKAAAAAGNMRARALDLISARPLSRAELLRRLSGKGDGEADPAAVADWLEGLGLLSDAEYARTVVGHYAAKGYGSYKIKDELYRRGVPKELWEDALAELADPAQAIDSFLSSRLSGEPGRAQIKKCYDALLRRGFTHGDISDGLRRRHISTEEE